VGQSVRDYWRWSDCMFLLVSQKAILRYKSDSGNVKNRIAINENRES
jgi:hypothetical protein